ncbi:hypothetical protein BB559_005880, partial [Furculomyces boomerangus]
MPKVKEVNTIFKRISSSDSKTSSNINESEISDSEDEFFDSKEQKPEINKLEKFKKLEYIKIEINISIIPPHRSYNCPIDLVKNSKL